MQFTVTVDGPEEIHAAADFLQKIAELRAPATNKDAFTYTVGTGGPAGTGGNTSKHGPEGKRYDPFEHKTEIDYTVPGGRGAEVKPKHIEGRPYFERISVKDLAVKNTDINT